MGRKEGRNWLLGWGHLEDDMICGIIGGLVI